MDDVSPNRSPNPTSEKKIKANRRNASKSTGPRTARQPLWIHRRDRQLLGGAHQLPGPRPSPDITGQQ